MLSSSDIKVDAKAMGDTKVEVRLKLLNECVRARVYMVHALSCTQLNVWWSRYNLKQPNKIF